MGPRLLFLHSLSGGMDDVMSDGHQKGSSLRDR